MSEDCIRADRPERAETCQGQRCRDEDTGDEYGDSEDVVSMDGDDLLEYEDGDEEEYEPQETEDGNINFLFKFYLILNNCSPICGRDQYS